jgi:EpsI family protein
MTGATLRFLSAAALLAAAAIFLQAHSRSEVLPPHLPLNTFPAELEGRTAVDIPIDKDQLEVLGNGSFLLRRYDDTNGTRPWVELFLAFYPSQRTGESPHSPQNCLPGAGWAPVQNSRVTLSFPGHAPFPVNRYVIAQGDSRRLVLYWYWAHDRGVANEYWVKYYLVADSIRMHRSDGSLVRMITDIAPNETPADAEQRLLPFASQVVPLLDQYIPR